MLESTIVFYHILISMMIIVLIQVDQDSAFKILYWLVMTMLILHVTLLALSGC